MSNAEEYQNLVSILKSALEFYGNKDNYDAKHPVNNVLFSHIEMDCGAQARFALQNIQQFENNHKILESDYIKAMSADVSEDENMKNVQKMIEEYKNLTDGNSNV